MDDVDVAIITTIEVSTSRYTDLEAIGFDEILKLQSSARS